MSPIERPPYRSKSLAAYFAGLLAALHFSTAEPVKAEPQMIALPPGIEFSNDDFKSISDTFFTREELDNKPRLESIGIAKSVVVNKDNIEAIKIFMDKYHESIMPEGDEEPEDLIANNVVSEGDRIIVNLRYKSKTDESGGTYLVPELVVTNKKN